MFPTRNFRFNQIRRLFYYIRYCASKIKLYFGWIFYRFTDILAQNYTWLSLSSYLMEFILLHFDSSEFEDERPSSLVTRGVSTDIASLSPSLTLDEDEHEVWCGNTIISDPLGCCFLNFFPLSTFA